MLLLFDRLSVDIQFPPLQICSYRMASRWLYMVMLFLLQLTQLSSQLSTKISTIKNFQSAICIQRKSHNVCYIQSCYIADTCTERVTHFGLSSGRHMHAWRAYFYKMHGKAVQQRITKIEFLGNKRWENADLQVHKAP